MDTKKQQEKRNIKFLRLVWEHKDKWLESPSDPKKTTAFWAFIAEEFKDEAGCQILKGPTQVSNLLSPQPPTWFKKAHGMTLRLPTLPPLNSLEIERVFLSPLSSTCILLHEAN